MGRALLFFISTMLVLGCNGLPKSSSVSGSPAQVLHVFNGSTLGFYTDTGSYGFKTKLASIFSMGQNFGTSQQFPQDTSNGIFYLGTTQCTTNCDLVLFFNGYSGGFRSGTINNSQASLAASGAITGLASDSTYNHLYVADSVHSTIYTLDAAIGAVQSGPTSAPSGQGANYLGFDSYLRRLFVAENLVGSVWAVDEVANTNLTTSPAILNITGGGCTASAVSYVVVNPLSHLAYVLCGNSVVMLRTSGLPSYFGTSPADSTFPLAPITQGNDIVYDNAASAVVVVGQHYVVGLGGTSGASFGTNDLLTGNCGFAAMDLEGVAYSSTKGTIYVADANNSVIYLLDAGTLNFKNGTCANSVYSTLTDVPNPKRISYF